MIHQQHTKAGHAGLSYGAFASCLVNLAALRHPVYGEKYQYNVL